MSTTSPMLSCYHTVGAPVPQFNGLALMSEEFQVLE